MKNSFYGESLPSKPDQAAIKSLGWMQQKKLMVDFNLGASRSQLLGVVARDQSQRRSGSHLRRFHCGWGQSYRSSARQWWRCGWCTTRPHRSDVFCSASIPWIDKLSLQWNGAWIGLISKSNLPGQLLSGLSYVIQYSGATALSFSHVDDHLTSDSWVQDPGVEKFHERS